jgi:hypothetical protein
VVLLTKATGKSLTHRQATEIKLKNDFGPM